MIITYRVFQEESGQYTFREVFYERDGRIITYGQTPIAPWGGSPAELSQELAWLNEALALPVLTIAELEAEIAAQPPKPKRTRKTISHDQLIAKLDLEQADHQAVHKAVIVDV